MEEKNCGTLFLVATPIGNLEDITFRAVRTLQESDWIAAEDTRHTMKLLNHYEIKKPLISYFEHNKKQRGEEIVRLLLAGSNVALVTDAGTPGISDPGEDIVKLAVQNNIPVTMIPGATASIMGLVLSGISCGRFCFEGFLPHDKKSRKKQLEALKAEERTIIFYLSPHRTLDFLGDVHSVLGNRKCAICRELTKKHEEVLRGTMEELAAELHKRDSIKGEMVLIVEGNATSHESEKDEWLSMTIEEHMALYLKNGVELKEAMKKVAVDRGVSRRDVYTEYLSTRKSTID